MDHTYNNIISRDYRGKKSKLVIKLEVWIVNSFKKLNDYLDNRTHDPSYNHKNRNHYISEK
jgi:hypothetical protein